MVAAAPREAPAGERSTRNTDPGGETFGHLPSAKQLYELLQASRTQLVVNWTQSGSLSCSYLARLWGFLRAVARTSQRRGLDPDGAAERFLAAWAALDKEWGTPGDRGWEIPSREADARQNLIEDYLVEAGPTSLVQAEADAPTNYLSEEELGR